MDIPSYSISRDPREEKLPTWARTTLNSLRNRFILAHERAGELEAENAALRGTPAEGNNTWRCDFVNDEDTPLGASPRIRFVLPDKARVGERYIIAHIEDGHLVVDGSHRLILRPLVANSMRIGVEED